MTVSPDKSLKSPMSDMRGSGLVEPPVGRISARIRYPGLCQEEVEESRRRHGINVLTPPARAPWWRLYLEKFEDPVIRILIIAAILSIATGFAHGGYVEGLGIVIAIFLATTMAFVNEWQANREFDILNKVSDEAPVKVARSGHYTTVPRRDIVVGDVVIIDQGDEVPADGRVLHALALQVDESKLTGESVPVPKGEEASTPDSSEPTAYPYHEMLRGTLVADGHGAMVVASVGDATDMGKTAQAAAEDSEAQSPLDIQLEGLSRIIGVVGFAVATLTFFALVVRGVLVGELVLGTREWYVVGVGFLSLSIALVRLWLPVCFDAFDLLGVKAEAPNWLDSDGIGAWLKATCAGLLVAALGLGVPYAMGSLPIDAGLLPVAVVEELLKFFMIAVTIIVVAVPEGLAMSVTLSLAYSMRKMTGSHILVRSLHACETIGAATIICSDKTGTLTMNRMKVADMHLPAGSTEECPVILAECISANSTAHLGVNEDGETKIVGNPTEGALLEWMRGHDIDYLDLRNRFQTIEQSHFSTERKYMATVVEESTGRRMVFVKGAPEILLRRCSASAAVSGNGPTELDSGRVLEELHACQQRGMRTIGFAWKELNGQCLDLNEIPAGMHWLGFAGLADPVRSEVPEAVRDCLRAGIAVKVVTGDSPQTAVEVARRIGLWSDADDATKLWLGNDFRALDDAEASSVAQRLKVLARARPVDKLRLVRLLQQHGNVVAVTGDGSNDAPALRHANVGLAMGHSGTAIAKEASDIILLDDSFASIRKSVLWGRSLYQNIQRFILFQLTINVAALMIALLGPFIGVKLPFTVTQMLWINLIMDTFAALALATEPPHEEVMNVPPRGTGDFIVTGAMGRSIFGVGGLFVAILVGFLGYLQSDGEISPYELSVFFTTFVMLQFWNLFNARCLGLNQSAFSGLSQNTGFLFIAACIFLGQVLLVQFGGDAFRTVPLGLRDWALVIALTSTVLWIGEFCRWFLRRGGQEIAERGV